jgi:hypothetical protein
MSRTSLRWCIVSAITLLVALSISACGGGSSGDDAVVAKVSDTSVTRADINHWMYALIGGDYYELSHRHTVPKELVSDPPNYPRCVKQLEVSAAASPKKIVDLTPLELLTKCRQLNEALKEQATNYVIAAHWVMDFNRELGISASAAEIETLFKQVKAREYPTEAAERNYLATQHLTLADELLIVKLDVLKNKDSQMVQSGGQKAYNKILAAEHHVDAKTTCHTGYVVAHCREYAGGDEQSYRSTPSPAVLMEQVAAIATGRCINYAACLKS